MSKQYFLLMADKKISILEKNKQQTKQTTTNTVKSFAETFWRVWRINHYVHIFLQHPLAELWYTFEPIKIGHLVLIHFWYGFDTLKKCIKYTLIHPKVYQIMIGDRKSYQNCMKCVLNGLKRFNTDVSKFIQKHVKRCI